MECPTCKANLPDSSKFCAQCGVRLSRVCSTCGHSNQVNSNFCSDCGAPLTQDTLASSSPVSHPPPSPASLIAEHRQLSVLFCDLVGSVELAERLDPDTLHDVLKAYHRRATAIVEAAGGVVAQYQGDGILAYFGYPVASEDDAERAIRAGLNLVNVFESSPALENLRLRVGIATGMAVVGELAAAAMADQPPIVGGTPNLAARLQSIAEPNTIIIAPSTKRLAGGLFEYADLGPQHLKGFSQPIRAWRVLGESVAASRFEALRSAHMLVGREEEVELLLRRWARAKCGEGQVVLVTGEAGIGKSRLTIALQERLTAEVHTHLIYHGSPQHQDSAFYPVISQLIRAAGIEREDSADQKLAKFETLFPATAENPKEIVSLLAPLLSIPLGSQYPALDLTPQRRKDRTFKALLDQLVVLAARQPVLLVLEDVHWYDPTTLELFSRVLDPIASLPVLMIMTARPEFSPPWPSHTHVSTVTLNRLGQDEVTKVAFNVAKGKALPLEVLEQILAHSDGVPLFVEELTKTVLESRLLDDAGDHYLLRDPLPSLAIPSTLYASLLARLDRLAAVKDVAQMASAIGREFSYSLIAAVAGFPEQELQAALGQLVAAELIFQRGLPPDATYLFKHALVQDAVYASLIRSRRHQIEAQIARMLEDRFPDVAASEPETLAHHFTAAGLAERGVHYWIQAGKHACDRSAFVEATRHFNAGIELLKTLPDTPARTQQELALYIGLGRSLIVTKGQPSVEVEQAYLAAHALCLQMGETPELARVLLGLWRCYISRSQLRKAREYAERLLRLSELTNDPAQAVVARVALGHCELLLAELPNARRRLEEGISRYAPEQRRAEVFRDAQDPGVASLSYSALSLWLLGFSDQAHTRSRDALALAHELKHPFSVAFAQCCFAFLSQFRRDVPNVREQADAAVALATEHGFSVFVAIATPFRGWASAMEGHAENGILELQQGIATMRGMGAGIWLPFRCSMLAEAFDLVGNASEGLQCLAEAQSLMDQTEERWWEAEIYRLQGALLLRHSIAPPAEVETWFRRALGVARRQNARSLELRAATSLARLWDDQGQHTQARDLLAPVYEVFTEGFDTFDLKEAKALLEGGLRRDSRTENRKAHFRG
jgi:class 3 adenylate cyclase/predicted ATPase